MVIYFQELWPHAADKFADEKNVEIKNAIPAEANAYPNKYKKVIKPFEK